MKTKEVVKQLLIDKPHLRDSDPKLIATYWFMELKRKKIDPTNINGLEFMHLFANGKLTNIKTISNIINTVAAIAVSIILKVLVQVYNIEFA